MGKKSTDQSKPSELEFSAFVKPGQDRYRRSGILAILMAGALVRLSFPATERHRLEDAFLHE
jgi:hypothetical protein